MKPVKSKLAWLVTVVLGLCMATFMVVGGSQTATATVSRASDDPPQDSIDFGDGEEESEEESLPVPPDLQESGPDSQPSSPGSSPPPASTPNPASPPATPAPAAPKPPAQPAPQPQTAAPVASGPPGYPDILFREFSGSWTGGPLVFRWWVSHCGEGRIKYPGGQLDFVMDRSQGDNGYPVSKTVSDFPVRGGKAVLTCHGIAPDPAVKSQEITIGPAPVSTQTVKVQKTKVVKVTKHGQRKTKTVKVAVQIIPPTPPDGVPGWCYTNSKGVWGFIQAPVAGSTRSLYTPGYGPHCDPPRILAEPNGKARWQWYLNTFYHGKDPRVRKK